MTRHEQQPPSPARMLFYAGIIYPQRQAPTSARKPEPGHCAICGAWMAPRCRVDTPRGQVHALCWATEGGAR